MMLPLSDVDDGGRWRWRCLPAVAIEPDSGSSPAWMTAWLGWPWPCFASPRDGSHSTVHTHTWNVRGSPEGTGDFRVRCGREKERRLARRPEASWLGGPPGNWATVEWARSSRKTSGAEERESSLVDRCSSSGFGGKPSNLLCPSVPCQIRQKWLPKFG